MAYTNDLRLKTLEYIKNGGKITKAHKIFGVGRQTVFNWAKRYKEQGNVDIIKPTYTHKKIDPIKLKELVNENPDMFLHELAEHFNSTAAGIWYALKKLGYTYKKNKYIQRK